MNCGPKTLYAYAPYVLRFTFYVLRFTFYPMILALDTSTDMAGIALYKPDEGVLAELSWRSGREQTTQLMPNVQRLMSLGDLRRADLTGVAVAIGPGSFSGVRTALSAAKS